MTFVIILNSVLAVAVVGGVLTLLSWAIVSSRPDQPQGAELRDPTPRPRLPHPHFPRPQVTPPRPSTQRSPRSGREPVSD